MPPALRSVPMNVPFVALNALIVRRRSADEERVAEIAEVARRQRETPRRIEGTVGYQAHFEIALRSNTLTKPLPGPDTSSCLAASCNA